MPVVVHLALLLLLLAPAAWAAPAPPKKAVILAEAGSDGFEVFFPDVYQAHKGHLVRPKQPVVLTFDENAYSPTLVQFVFKLIVNPRDRIVSHRLTEVPPPVLLLAPGDTIRVKYNHDQNTYAFRGRHQAELDFCRRLWQSTAPLARLFGNVGEPVVPLAELDSTESPQYYIGITRPPTRLPLSQHLRNWYGLKQAGEAHIAELRRLAGVRPEIAASLARHIRLGLFTMLTGAVCPRSSHDSLRVISPAYRDTVAAEARLLTAMQQLLVTAADGLGGALLSYNQYQCVQERHFPTVGTQYTHAKQALTGFYRAWVCYLILNDGRIRHQDIRRWQHDYETWVKPYNEFARVLRGEPTVPLRSYQAAVTTDSLVSAVGQTRHLTDLLAAYQGKVVLLDLWASWCVPCREEIPNSVAVANKYRSRGLVVLYLSIDKEAAEWQQALRKLPATARNQYRFQNPSATAFRQQFEINSVPRYLLIDRTGTIRYDDALRPGDPRFGAVLEKLLAR